MLRKLELRNFKTWQRAELEFGKITGLFGANSSGKSSLIQLLLLLKQTKEVTDRAISLELNGSYVSLGLFKDMVFNHDEKLKLNWMLQLDMEAELQLPDYSQSPPAVIARGRELTVAGEVGARGQGASAERLEYALGGIHFMLAPKVAGGTNYELTSSGHSFRFVRTRGRPWQLPGPIKSYAFPDQVRTYFQNAYFLSDLEAVFDNQMDRIFYLGPLRESPHRDYLWARSRPADVGQRGEKAIDAILAATADREMRNLARKARRRPFQDMIAHWLRQMGLIHDFKVEEIADGSNRWQARIRVREGASEVLLTDVGFGVSRILPVITLLQYVPERSTVILEQPEIHLHPLAQANLADVLINAARHRGVQVIVESHSEHLLLRLQRRVAEQELPSKDLRLYFCDVANAVSRLKPLEMDMFGKIGNWPEHFMGDAFGEAYAAERARLDRMAAAE